MRLHQSQERRQSGVILFSVYLSLRARYVYSTQLMPPQGHRLLRKFRFMLNPRQITDLSTDSPNIGSVFAVSVFIYLLMVNINVRR